MEIITRSVFELCAVPLTVNYIPSPSRAGMLVKGLEFVFRLNRTDLIIAEAVLHNYICRSGTGYDEIFTITNHGVTFVNNMFDGVEDYLNNNNQERKALWDRVLKAWRDEWGHV